MPRKTNGIEFELHPSPKRDEEGKPLLYARPASGRKKTMKQLDDFCAEYRNLQKGEMERLFNLFLDVAGNWLSQGYRVETPIGSLSIKLKLVGEHSDPDKVTGRDILYATARKAASWATARCTTPRRWRRRCAIV